MSDNDRPSATKTPSGKTRPSAAPAPELTDLLNQVYLSISAENVLRLLKDLPALRDLLWRYLQPIVQVNCPGYGSYAAPCQPLSVKVTTTGANPVTVTLVDPDGHVAAGPVTTDPSQPYPQTVSLTVPCDPASGPVEYSLDAVVDLGGAGQYWHTTTVTTNPLAPISDCIEASW